ncbi:phosphoglycolate phosphatase [Cryobacterium mesophilum]|uniref:HAD family hydrolase n=1 Tax=Terrimesophilobacter mesophilus TaxID=433647 RepID=A0A4R8VBD8_9MICO|nr:HAD hydrolase-like protein [Terrimesophilobacter mesophilus]MBB5633186.1 phosphoglycolate phosphatase [Terrimesophilobacter mesophilus]TFB79935.1 HAD family hydrolase [Terrimesophilobacter mesophilus]
MTDHTKSAPWTCILFDLDGTIADSAPGITASLGFMFEKLGLPVPSQEELRSWVGPPILESFRDRAGMNQVESAQALAIYRQHYLANSGNGSPIYPGVSGILRDIHSAGIPLALATSKPEFAASLILDHGNITQYFRVISGSSIDEIRSAKKDVIAEAVNRFTMIEADLSNPVMVGDRYYDVEGAEANGIPAIYVEWGYGSPEESKDAIASVGTSAELQELLLP